MSYVDEGTPDPVVAAQIPTVGPTSPGSTGEDGDMTTGDTLPMVAAPNTPDATPAPQPTDQIGQPGDNAYMGGADQPMSTPNDTIDSSAGCAADVGNADTISPEVAGAVTAAMDRRDELQTDTYGSDSTIGDLMNLPDVPSDTGKITGGSMAHGADYADN